MSVFAYRALDERAAPIEGTIAADSPRAARDVLRGRGLIVEQVTQQSEQSSSRWSPWRRRNRYAAKRVEAVRELSTLLAAGIPLLEALAVLPHPRESHEPRCSSPHGQLEMLSAVSSTSMRFTLQCP